MAAEESENQSEKGSNTIEERDSQLRTFGIRSSCSTTAEDRSETLSTNLGKRPRRSVNYNEQDKLQKHEQP